MVSKCIANMVLGLCEFVFENELKNGFGWMIESFQEKAKAKEKKGGGM